ncbi:pyridoxamine 5'-phosphate oxidase family protein [uncultured Desulfosarcina sp.]|uniref:pyridoxamine 5'-phosphate oxidase family protein n=1 Tax=uncultured Desulfosarcina sp. TaxID=218289 RepID=UPI0029C64537|nr:pyridoxamine 5'-phosphate oxidase family protein [uncultured Desulfosarcina sp.]
MNPDESVKRGIHDLLRQQPLGVLSTVGDDAPYASLVAFAASNDGRCLYFATPRATRKFENIAANDNVALLVNNSVNLPEEFHRAKAVTAVGIARPLTDEQLDVARNRYLDKHPYLESFAHSPDCVFLEIRVQRYILVEHFQNVSEYRIDHEKDQTS